ncbi:MAG: flagellar basal body P-ring formation protein FlgA [Myxococcales bacterium]|nr:flagellar basal body P-ring formation protein FlgA [Myxococcales bacterium]
MRYGLVSMVSLLLWNQASANPPAPAQGDAWSALILSAARAQTAAAGERLTLQALRLPARLPERPDPAQIRVEFRQNEDFSGPTVVGLIVEGRRTWARVSFERLVPAVTAARDLPAGTMLAGTDLVSGFSPARPEAGVICQDVAAAVGQKLRAFVKAGEPIRADRLERPQVVQAGEPVSIELVSGAVRLRVGGQALAPGRVGDRIPVQNLQSGRRVEARVLGAARVAVETPASPGGEP